MQTPTFANLKTAIHPSKKHSNFYHYLRQKCLTTRSKNTKKRKACVACRLRDWSGLRETEDPVSMHNSEESISSQLFMLSEAGHTSLHPTSQDSVLIICEHKETCFDPKHHISTLHLDFFLDLYGKQK